MISFVTAIKLMPGYEDFAQRLKVYIECLCDGCERAGVDFEILVVEDRCSKNVGFVRLEPQWLEERRARLIPYEATYANPHGFNLIEAYAKNAGIRAARFPYVCVTNCDLVFGDGFFAALQALKPRTFYRFLQYEVPVPEAWHWHLVKPSLPAAMKCLNPDLADAASRTINCVAHKSGDIMLMDAASWAAIQGYPENDVWFHSDLVVCQVVANNRLALEVPEGARVYTYPQARAAIADSPQFLDKATEYLTRLTCN